MGATHFKPGDYVEHTERPGVRGMVLWTDDCDVFVCWEVGFDTEVRHDAGDLIMANVLDMLVQGRVAEFEFCPTKTRCTACGRKTSRTKHGYKCSYCDRDY